MHQKCHGAATATREFAAGLIAIIFSFLLVLSPTHKAAELAPARPQPNQPTLVFAISGDTDSFSMDAVVAVNGKQFRAPFPEENEAQQEAFAKKYLAAGLKYRLMFGGGEAGTVTVKEWSRGCNTVHASVEPSTLAKLGERVMALATNATGLGNRPGARRALTDVERVAAMALVKRIYTQNRTTAALYRLMRVTNLTATDLDGDGKYEVVGSFTLESESGNSKFRRELFLIAAPLAKGFRADFVKFQSYKLMPEGFGSAIDFVDQLDLDGDGVGEVFATQQGFDAYGYLIYQKRAGRWRLVYSGLGDAC